MKNVNKILTTVALTVILTLPTLSNASVNNQGNYHFTNVQNSDTGLINRLVPNLNIIAQVSKKSYNQTQSSKSTYNFKVAMSDSDARARRHAKTCFQGNWRDCLTSPSIPKGQYPQLLLPFLA